MDINCFRFRLSLAKLFSFFKNDESLVQFVGLDVNELTERNVENILKYLAKKLLDPDYTEAIAVCFPDILLPIVVQAIPINDASCDPNIYLCRSMALSKLSKYSPEVLKYSVTYFSGKEAPFKQHYLERQSKRHKPSTKYIAELDIIKCSHDLLASSPSIFKDLWNWSEFLEQYNETSNDLQRLYYNQILSILFSLSQCQLNFLNKHVPEEIMLNFHTNLYYRLEIPILNEIKTIENNEKVVKWSFSSSVVTNIEGIMLLLYNPKNAESCNESDENFNKIVKVDSTKTNLKSLAMGLLSDKPICLFGPVGCGKTTLVEHLARTTGRITPHINETIYKSDKTSGIGVVHIGLRNAELSYFGKRKLDETEEREVNTECNVSSRSNGFLRIQLGEQTDTKLLLGQYRCTDIPGEFVWYPGALTQAVMKGLWLLLEDVDLAPDDTCTMLSHFLESKYLSVPGFRDNIKISPGFQLFVTVRSPKSINIVRKSTFTILSKYFYSFHLISMSRKELCQIVSVNFPKLATIASRIVDIYLVFSSGNHASSENNQAVLGEDASSVSAIINSGRTVSTRDLIKLCCRSYAAYSATSIEYAYFVFENAIDIFCSYLPNTATKRNLMMKIGAKLGIMRSRCEFFFDDYMPNIVDNINGMKLGRASLQIKNSTSNTRKRQSDTKYNELLISKKSKLDSNANFALLGKERVTFSFTRLACCLLERIGVCISQAEPILLVGETGVGKTSCIQYLAGKTNHRLIVVNMNNQSDISDLVGGFKPVDISYMLSPIRFDFEVLFRATFNEIKNENFLSNVSACYNRGEFRILIKLMLKIINIAFQRIEGSKIKVVDLKNVLNGWKELKCKLIRLNTQQQKCLNGSFAFITGSLVKCIQNGDWVLLDEINLASDETLECLSTILEREGSVILLEKGELTPVKRHQEFRIFACMNPRTDIGKKDLPTGIRNRFTEFFVDELRNDNDLTILVGDYLKDTGISATKISSIVKLYKKLKALSEIDLNDGLGNKPVYSLRTLCRALTICARNLCGSIERNLFESFCVGFLTQLDNESHTIVLDLIKTYLLTDPTAILSQQIPKPGNNFINFEGYWIEKGINKPTDCPEYILTDTVRANLKDIARIIFIGKLPILLQGPTSAGKTSLIEYIAKRSGNICLRINNHEHTDLQEYIGTYIADITGKLIFKEGILVEAMRHGHWVILDELNLASTDILEALNRVLDDNRELYIPETQKVVKAHTSFMLFATQNPPGLYGGRKTLSRAFKNRFIELHFSEIPKTELEIILEKRCHIPKSSSQKMVKCMYELQINRKTTGRSNFTLRDLFRWGNRYTYANEKLLGIASYDWNQHLVDEGYLILSSNVRTEIEVEIIEKTLFTNFQRRVDVNNLFTYQKNTSLVTKSILKSLISYTLRNDIIWTKNMTRTAVLTAKALEFHEPVLLVGPTASGKTTICQILAAIRNKHIRILNCHMHTEGADFLGGLRPCRRQNNSEINSSHLFEWIDGPVVEAMLEGSYFMADEISLAEDSVLERLNSVLESNRTIVLAEKGGLSSKTSKEFIIHACDGFEFLATMNPGGDYGKKELSPALRNRFTEIWCLPSNNEEDLMRIAINALNLGLTDKNGIEISKVAELMIKLIKMLKTMVEKFTYSVRDILAWVNYISVNNKNSLLTIGESFLFGFNTLFLDSLEILSNESEEKIISVKSEILKFALQKIEKNLDMSVKMPYSNMTEAILSKEGNNFFGINPFYIEVNKSKCQNPDFAFNAPTTRANLFRLLSALSVKKAILLEGPPGVGKTSIIENLARIVGYRIVRINLCEHTDLADLFGTYLPAEKESNDLNLVFESSSDFENLGSFMWRDGPLLAALKDTNTWVLLDELNLAPQSVLEGLNAILDHRGEVFIPELNKSFSLERGTRIFACQNPLRQGGGRKGLPQSFLNRFTKVYLSKLTAKDLLHIVKEKFLTNFKDLELYFEQFLKHIKIERDKFNFFSTGSLDTLPMFSGNFHKTQIEFDLFERMVQFSVHLNRALDSLDFGIRGGPFEINLRDLLRWCEFLFDPDTGLIESVADLDSDNGFEALKEKYRDFLLILYERMKLIYYQRMRSETDRIFIQKTFSEVFECDSGELNDLSEDVSLYWTDSEIFLNDIVLKRTEECGNCDGLPLQRDSKSRSLLLSCQIEIFKNIVECLNMEKVILLSGPSNSGKTKILDAVCELSNHHYDTEIIEDSVMGSFQQIDLIRHLEEAANNIEYAYTKIIHQLIKCVNIETQRSLYKPQLKKILASWYNYSHLSTSIYYNPGQTSMSEELLLFKNRIKALQEVIFDIKIMTSDGIDGINGVNIAKSENVLKTLERVVKMRESLITSGHFEWVDSKIVKRLKSGGWICLEHANLCSPAILDRLNPAFEPKGSMLLTEKGINLDNQIEAVDTHNNFRVFLTIDPKHGDLSRAMRNRCVELDLSRKVFSEDDYRQIVYITGVREHYLIDAILSMYYLCNDLAEPKAFDISHLKRCTFLFGCNKRAGFNSLESLCGSGEEVFVTSSTIDLLGFGLEFYKRKLREIVYEVSRSIVPSVNICNLDNVILDPKNLNQVSLVKLQSEPLFAFLKCHPDIESTKRAITSLYACSSTINYVNNVEFIKCYISILYGVSSVNDLALRYKQLSYMLLNISQKNDELEELEYMNERVYNMLMENIKLVAKNENLPWNTKLFPRMKSKKDDRINSNRKLEMRLSSMIHAYCLTKHLDVEKTTKIDRISAIGYSKGVFLAEITDSFNNFILKQVWPLMSKLEDLLHSSLPHIDINIKEYPFLILSFMWYNRLYICSKNTLLFGKDLNVKLIDKLLLHMKWLAKNLIKRLQKTVNSHEKFNDELITIVHRIERYALDNKHPLNWLQKKYSKIFAGFMPRYSQEQIELYLLHSRVNEIINTVSDFHQNDEKMFRKALRFAHTEEVNSLKSLMSDDMSDILKYIKKTEDAGIDESIIAPIEVHSKTHKYFKELEMHKRSEKTLAKIQELASKLEETYFIIAKDDLGQLVCKSSISDLLPIKEYFVTRALQLAAANPETMILNEKYFSIVSDYSCSSLLLIKVLMSVDYRQFQPMWQTVLKNLVDNKDINQVLTYLSPYYRNFSTFNRVLTKMLQSHQLSTKRNSSLVNKCITVSLTDCLYLLLFQEDGHLKPITLNELNNRKESLNDACHILWNNSVMISNEFSIKKEQLRAAWVSSEKLALEIAYLKKIVNSCGGISSDEYNDDFEELLRFLHDTGISAQNLLVNNRHQHNLVKEITLNTALINSLLGATELCLTTYLPSIDPVEKNRLKSQYENENRGLLKNIISVYDLLRTVMRYKGLAEEEYRQFVACLDHTQKRLKSMAKSLAVRPEKCAYRELAEHIAHFLKINMKPANFVELIKNLQRFIKFRPSPLENMIEMSTFFSESSEMIKKIDLWIAISGQFLLDLRRNFATYYIDFVEPLECCTLKTQTGLSALKELLLQHQNSFHKISDGAFSDFTENGWLCKTLHEIFKFPNVKKLNTKYSKTDYQMQHLASLVAKLSVNLGDLEILQLKMLNAGILDVKNDVSITCLIDERIFTELQSILKSWNEIWRLEEAKNRKKQTEEEKLYVNKVHCKTKTEEELEVEEAQKQFPIDIRQDFGEYLTNGSLEPIEHVPEDQSYCTKATSLISAEEHKHIAINFMHIMINFTKIYYYYGRGISNCPGNLNYVAPFTLKLDVFSKLINKYRMCLNSAFDSAMYSTYVFIIGLQQDFLKVTPILDGDKTYSNFYKDSNIPQIKSCLEILEKIIVRTKEQLAVYPEHAVLTDIVRIVDKVKSFPSTSPVARFNTGFQMLCHKLSQWNTVAHKNNHFRDLEAEVADYVQKWTKLELQYWRNCLQDSIERVENDSYKYFSYLYNLLHEYLNAKDKETIMKDITSAILNFVESSNYADFAIRLNLLRSFELYLHQVNSSDLNRKDHMIAILRNIRIYFDQFHEEIKNSIQMFRTPIEKKIRDLVKIESYNKDLSYVSIKNNVTRVHRNLYKLVREYENQLRKNISLILQQKSNAAHDYNLENDKGINLRYESKHKYYMIDTKNFLARLRLGDIYNESTLVSISPSQTLLSKCEKLFLTSRTIVKESINNIKYPEFIHCLDVLLMDQLEACEHLRKLEVDRSKPKAKQKKEATIILSQKKKGLSDLYKTLSNLGFNYKTGLMELSFNRELIDYQIKPFCIKTMFTSSKSRKLEQNLIWLSENLDFYYSKSIFRLKVLLNAMLTPNAELGTMHIDRIKGFSVDMFLLVQQQRKVLAGFTKDLYDLRKTLERITIITELVKTKFDIDEQLNFGQIQREFYCLRNAFCEIQSFLYQYNLLLKCKPDMERDDTLILKQNDRENDLNRTDINETLLKISADTQKILQESLHTHESEFIDLKKLQMFRKNLKETVIMIEKLRDELRRLEKDHFTLTKPLDDLLDTLTIQYSRENFIDNDISLIEKVDITLENIIYTVLLSLQKIYKKKVCKSFDRSLNYRSEVPNAVKTSLIVENHLKENICGKMFSDIEDLRILELNKKLTDIMIAVKYIGSTQERVNHINKLHLLLPILEQFSLMCEFYLFQQLGAHKVSTKMVSLMLAVFVELATKGFCIPQDLFQDEEGQEEKISDNQGGGFGFEDGSGEKDVSDKIETEDQLDDAKKPEDRNNDNEGNGKNTKEEKGIEMSEDFNEDLQDVNEGNVDGSENSEDDESKCEKQMGEVDNAMQKLDDQIWGTEGENADDEDEAMSEQDEGRSNKNEESTPNDTGAATVPEMDNAIQEGLDTTREYQDKNCEINDIDSMEDPEEVDNDQMNSYHNKLEEPVGAEEMDLDNFNLDGDNNEEDENISIENPFDIDQIKNSMKTNDSENLYEGPTNADYPDMDIENDSDSDSFQEGDSKDYGDQNRKEEKSIEENIVEEISELKQDTMHEEKHSGENKNPDEIDTKLSKESKYNPCDEDDIDSSKDNQNYGSNDQVAGSDVAKKESSVDQQDTGEDRANVGQAENDSSASAHQGVGDSNQSVSEEIRSNNNPSDKQRRNVDEERTLGMEDTHHAKQLMTVDGLMNSNEKDLKADALEYSNEFQHVREEKEKDILTLDTATEDQSKKNQHYDEENKAEKMQDIEVEIINEDDEKKPNYEVDNVSEITEENIEKVNQPCHKLKNAKETCEFQEKVKVKQDSAKTHYVPRGTFTSAHYKKDVLNDNTSAEEPSVVEVLEVQKKYRNDLTLRKQVLSESADSELWQSVSNKMSSNARDLCEQLRLILEPTKCTRLKGDYRSGRRINMRKIIPYIASQFRKDKIWLRRTKAAQRDYKITIAIDDSKSMQHNHSRRLTLEAISLISQALTLLESGKLSIISFGESAKVLLHHTEQLDGPKLVHELRFEQIQSKIAELVEFVIVGNSEEGLGGGWNMFENLLLIISDGRNIFSEGEQKVKRAIKLARSQRIFLIYVIIDNPENKHSILDIRAPQFSVDRKTITMMSYLDTFPFPYYVIVRDLGQLPTVLSEAMRQWFELVNSEN